jgi:hypothetical protein
MIGVDDRDLAMKSILDPSFECTPRFETDIHQTFARVASRRNPRGISMKPTSIFWEMLLQELASVVAVGLLGCAASAPRPVVAVDETRYLVEAGLARDAISRGKAYCADQGNEFEAIDIVPEMVKNDGTRRDAIVTFTCI